MSRKNLVPDPVLLVDPSQPDELAAVPAALRRVVDLFAVQHGVASDLQIRGAGVSWKRQSTLIDRQMWRRYAPGVIVDAGTASTWHQGAMAATLMPGSSVVLAGAAAARLHGLDGFGDVERLIVLTSKSGRVRSPAEVTVNRTRLLTPLDVTTVDGIAATTVAVTLLHLSRYGLEFHQALDSAIRLGNTPVDIQLALNRWRKMGVHGPAAVLDALHERVDARLPRSWFQRLASMVLSAAGIEMVDEWPVRDANGKLLAEPDLAIVSDKVGVECQSWEWHSTPTAQRRDAARKRMLRRMGWDIVDLWWSDLDRIDDVVTDIREAIERSRLLQAVRSPTSLSD